MNFSLLKAPFPRTAVVAALVLATMALAGPLAAKESAKNKTKKKSDADDSKSYVLTDAQGPWMILAVTFSGDEADGQARELVGEIRRLLKLPAYIHEMQFDYSQGAVGRGMDQYGKPLKMKYQTSGIREIAVMVGNYATVDDPRAQKALKTLKKANLPCLDLPTRVEEGKRENRTLAALRLSQQYVQELMGSKRGERGPMGHAFITTNPLLPDEYFAPQGVDPLVLEMNRDVKYSLLDCPAKYSCKVATFTGHVLIDQKLIEKVEQGRNMPSRLEQAADNAHKLTVALRAKRYEAYEFHDRYASIVTVGSFQSVGTPRRDGKIEIDPRLHAIMKTFGAEQRILPGQATPSFGKVKTLVGIPFDLQALPVEVPARSIGRDYDPALLDDQ